MRQVYVVDRFDAHASHIDAVLNQRAADGYLLESVHAVGERTLIAIYRWAAPDSAPEILEEES